MRVSIMPLPGLDEEVDEILGADYQILQRWHKIHSGKLEKEVEEALMDEIISLGEFRAGIMYRIEKGIY